MTELNIDDVTEESIGDYRLTPNQTEWVLQGDSPDSRVNNLRVVLDANRVYDALIEGTSHGKQEQQVRARRETLDQVADLANNRLRGLPLEEGYHSLLASRLLDAFYQQPHSGNSLSFAIKHFLALGAEIDYQPLAA